MPVEELVALVRYLPDDAAVRREMDPTSTWTVERELLAIIAERSDAAARGAYDLAELTYRVHAKHPKRWEKWTPLRIPRPGDKPKAVRRQATAAELAQMFPGKR